MIAAPRQLWSVFLSLAPALTLYAQTGRIAVPIDESRTVLLTGSVRPGVSLLDDRGPAEPDFPLAGITLYLKQSASQQAALQQFLLDLQDPTSLQYHRWLTPEQYAERFGCAPAEIDVLTEWLRSQGFSVGKVARSRNWMVFSGTAQQVENTFHTEIHRYQLSAKMHFANATAPSIPAALADVVMGIDGLGDFTQEPVPTPQIPTAPNTTTSSGSHTLAPDDLAVIYNIAPLYAAGIDGTGQKIAVAGSTQFGASALADVAAFRAHFNLPPNVPQPVLDTDYPDPGVNNNTLPEAHLDIEWAGAVARNATIIFVYSQTFIHAVQYAVDNNLAQVITESANLGCEAQNSSATMDFYRALAQQANAQGITWVNSGGDSGAAACDANGAPIAVGGLGVRFPASIPEVTAVGGTEFNEQGGSYWATNNTANGASAMSYIPEMVWNDSLADNALWAGGGGASTYFAKPAWQSGTGVPKDQARDMPDVALAASFNHDGYYVYRGGASFTSGGTSASSPVFAGVVALIDQYLLTNNVITQPGLGNINPTLYRLAQTTSGVFHDITTGTNIVPCQAGSPDCTNGSLGYGAGPGYDQASGLGSIDVANLVNQWSTEFPPRSRVVLSETSKLVGENASPPRSSQPGNGHWMVTITATETAGIATTVTSFTIDGISHGIAAVFGGTAIPANGSISGTVVFPIPKGPARHVLELSGVDAGGIQWSQQESVSSLRPSSAQ
jgi:subtilase family serine protease